MLTQLARHVCANAGIDLDRVPPASPLPIDGEERAAWITRIASGLRTAGVRELAYVVVYLVTVADLEIAPAESAFLDQLRDALDIANDRASDIAVTVSSMLTPGTEEAREHA